MSSDPPQNKNYQFLAIIIGLVIAVLVVYRIGGNTIAFVKAKMVAKAVEEKRQAELRREAELAARRLADQVLTTQATLDEAIKNLATAKTLEDWVGRYKDAWNHPIKIVRMKGHQQGVSIRSAGPDGEFGTDDDLKTEKTEFSFTGGIGALWSGKGEQEVTAPEEEKPAT